VAGARTWAPFTFVPDSAGPLADLPPVEDESVDLYTDFLPADVDVSAPPQRWFAGVDGRGRVRWRQTGSGGMDLLVLVCHLLAMLRPG